MNSEDIRLLKYSPIFVSEILHSFCAGSKRINDEGVKFELIYLVLPFVMDDDFRKKLIRAKINSTFKTIFLDKNSELKDKLFYINDKVKHSKKVTNDGLIYLNSVSDVSVGEYFYVTDDFKRNNELGRLKKEYFKAAYNLGRIFTKEGYVNVLLKSKVTNV